VSSENSVTSRGSSANSERIRENTRSNPATFSSETNSFSAAEWMNIVPCGVS
jgi:hypothetical protein